MTIHYSDELPPSRDVLRAMAETAQRDEAWVHVAQRECEWMGAGTLDGALADVIAHRQDIARRLQLRRYI